MRVAYKLRVVPTILGLIFTICSFTLLSGHSIPYQDPTPELLAHQAGQIKDAELMVGIGIAFTILGIIYYLVIRRLYNKRKTS